MIDGFLNFGQPTITYSIVGSTDWSDARDVEVPFTFFQYLENITASCSPEQYNNHYESYLHQWYALKNVAEDVKISEIKLRYIELLQSIALDYTTAEEKRFINNIDYTDPLDVAVVAPIYANKLREICEFFAKKRDSIKVSVVGNRYKGSSISLERCVYDTIIEHILTRSSEEFSANTNLQTILSYADVDIVEYVDSFSEYFNIKDGATASDSGIRESYLTANTNPLSANIFIDDQSIIYDVLTTPIYLKEIGTSLLIDSRLLINQKLGNPSCTIDDITALINADTESLSSFYTLKKKLIKKYIGTDYYYLSTNSAGQYVTGALFEADNPSGNLLNQRYPTTASIPSNDIQSLQSLGLFFSPDKMGLIQFASTSHGFVVDNQALKQDHIYIFPDPMLVGNVSNTWYNEIDSPLIFSIDTRSNIKLMDYGVSCGAVKSNESLQNCYAYYSAPIYVSPEYTNISSFDPYLTRIFDDGVFTTYHQDVYGNEYGIIKDVSRFNQAGSVSNVSKNTCIVLDGYSFYDPYSEYSFNYSITGENYDGSIRTGLTASTSDNFALISAYTVYLREYVPYFSCDSNPVYVATVYDGGDITTDALTLLADVSSDTDAFTSDSPTYYNLLLESGLSASNINSIPYLNSALSAVPSITASNYLLVNGSSLNIEPILEPDNERSTVPYFNDVFANSATVLSTERNDDINTINDIRNLYGSILVKNISTNQVLTIQNALSSTYSKYPISVQNAVYGNGIKAFELIYDTLVVSTSSYTVFDKIKVVDGQFVKPGTPNRYISYHLDDVTCISNCFYNENDQCIKMAAVGVYPNALSASNQRAIFPSIYSYSLRTGRLSLQYPTSGADVFVNALSAVNIKNVSNACLSYSSDNDKYSLTWRSSDLNGMDYITSTWFHDVDGSVIINENDVVMLAPESTAYSYNFYEPLSTFSNFNVVSSNFSNVVYQSGSFIML